MFIDFDIPWLKPKKLSEALGKPMPVAGHTVPQEWWENQAKALEEIMEVLSPFATVGGLEGDTPLQLAQNARDLLRSTAVTIKQLNRDNANLIEQLDDTERLRSDAFLAYDEQVRKNTELHAEIERLKNLMEAKATVKAKRSPTKKAGA